MLFGDCRWLRQQHSKQRHRLEQLHLPGQAAAVRHLLPLAGHWRPRLHGHSAALEHQWSLHHRHLLHHVHQLVIAEMQDRNWLMQALIDC